MCQKTVRGKVRIAHIITGLNVGGAEIMLYRLLAATDRDQFYPIVISLTKTGIVGEKITKLGIAVYECDMGKNIRWISSLKRMVIFLRQEKIDIIQTWMYHADFFGGIIGKLMKIPVVWGIHNRNLIKGKSKSTTILIARINAVLSELIPTKIVCCSKTALTIHKNLGYCLRKIQFIPNGFDCSIFKPNQEKRIWMRKQLNIEESTFVIGMFARFDPQKDHKNLIEAAKIFFSQCPQAKLVLCGDRIDEDNQELCNWIREAGINKYIKLLGRRDDIEDIFAILDVFTLTSSFGEAFPLVVGEAMLSQVPCIVTNVGDSAYLVAETGIIVPIKQTTELAAAWKKFYDMNDVDRKAIGKRARARMKKYFSIEGISSKYREVYMGIIASVEDL